ncbi:FAD binding domain-containing protein [Thozetella sp. PMI_491]|nr:FAD binding domain-containing protein [Thozetella sp. PMI_491]
MAPKNVVIVGGSIAGLIHGIYLKHQGSIVVILEQDPDAERYSHHAGINIGPNLLEFLKENDDCGIKIGIPAPFLAFGWRKYPRVLNLNSPRVLTHWGLLYRVLRANFDGMASKTIPTPPTSREGDGHTEYRRGKRVVELQDNKEEGTVDVQFVDVRSGVKETIAADLVIGADGINSAVRRLLEPESRTKEYAGYVAWRGTVPERLVSSETAQYFKDRVTGCLMKGSYLIVYLIPTEDGGLGPDERLLNWVWYQNVAEGSPEMDFILTDINGTLHQNTVQANLIPPETWKQQFAGVVGQMLPPVVELISKTSQPFVTKVNDMHCKIPSFYDGRVVLVGDAMTAIRPHSAIASDHAATHCSLLSKVWRNEMSMAMWDRAVLFTGERLALQSRALGILGQGTIYSFFKALIGYIWFLVRARWD